MFCQKCSLHYPDHLSFCRRCGQTLVRSNSEMVMESYCCTRCGARIVRGENFCQHCGNRVGVTLQETVIGACYHCGTSWRSGWLFCKNCGLDRKRALLLSTSTPSPGSAKVASQPVEEFPEIARLKCKSCGVEAKPYSRFCEACGANLDGVGRPTLSAEAVSPVQTETPSTRLREKNISERVSSHTIFEPPAPSTPQVKLTRQPEQRDHLQGQMDNVSSQSSLMSEIAAHSADQPNISTENYISAESLETVNNSISNNAEVPGKTVVTPLPPFGGGLRNKRPDTLRDFWARNRIILQSAVLIGLVALLIAVVFWWVAREQRAGVEGLSSSVEPMPSRPSASPDQNVASAITLSQPTSITIPEGMVYVPGGKFEMGRDGVDEYERPAHMVTVKPFFIDRTEVTNVEYQRFVNATGHRIPSHWKDGKFAVNEAAMPVVNVSWDDANAYAKWANKRLPTEAEWEFAARGTDGRIYPWGNNWNPAAGNAGHENGGRIFEVGRFPNGASPFGALDMCGNVWEWTSSSLRSYADEKKEIASGKVIRGGAFDAPSSRATTTYRGVLPADRMRDKTGFRAVRDIR